MPFYQEVVFYLVFVWGILICCPAFLDAKVTGDCVNCHTMHNSQGGVTMNGQASPYRLLVRSECLGCHAIGGAQRIATFAGQDTPQVYHTDPVDLAGGNFAYITGDKGSGGDTKGHNVVDFGDPEGTHTLAPGARHLMANLVANLTCSGGYGCHGVRLNQPTGVASMKGAHHGDVDGKCDEASETYDSYRFLRGVKGLENTGTSKWQNASSTDHNEYFGATTPMSDPACTSCHPTAHGPGLSIKPANQTMSGLCATCHWYFHSVDGIGGDTTSPFTRHPSDVVLPSVGEYAAYTTYDKSAPVARTTVPDSPGSSVTPGTDVVMCLSCHMAHASNFDDLLRWDYSSIIAGGGSSDAGCFVCHTTKDNGS